MNKFITTGFLTRDPELKKLEDGNVISNSSIAINKKWKDKNGEEQTNVVFIDIVFWNKLAQNSIKFLQKGSNILIEGELVMGTWKDKTTDKTFTKHSIKVISVQYLNNIKTKETEEKIPSEPF